MIIAISAAPPVLTGPLARELAASHRLEVVSDPTPGLCAAYGFQTLYDMPVDLRSEMRLRLITEHSRLIEQGANLVVEQSIFPWLADWMRWHWAHTPTDAWEAVQTTAGRVAGCYDAIYHVDCGPARAYDGYTWLDRNNASQINRLLRGLYTELGVIDRVRYLTEAEVPTGP
jgi:hypothetical protein